MKKYYGKIGFATTIETTPGVWSEKIVEHTYYGDWIQNTGKFRTAEKVNDDIVIQNTLSIVADPYARNTFHAIRYATYMGQKWKVTSVEVNFPRLNLSLGGIYNAH